MKRADDILNNLILVGGPPRSGTTFAARSLNLHPVIMTAIDDQVYESWGLYYYRTRTGLVQKLRNGGCGAVEIHQALKEHLFRNGCLVGIAPSEKTAGCPRSPLPLRPDTGATTRADLKLIRHSLPLSAFRDDWQLCLKSPEISYILPQLAAALPGARFVIVYRPLIEIAESMLRKGHTVKGFPVFHRRWRDETDDDGRPIPPPGVPQEWAGLWPAASDFQRCVINAASYMRALAAGLAALEDKRCFVYNHACMREKAAVLFQRLAEFLQVDAAGFQGALKALRHEPPGIAPELAAEYEAMEQKLELSGWFRFWSAGSSSCDCLF